MLRRHLADPHYSTTLPATRHPRPDEDPRHIRASQGNRASTAGTPARRRRLPGPPPHGPRLPRLYLIRHGARRTSPSSGSQPWVSCGSCTWLPRGANSQQHSSCCRNAVPASTGTSLRGGAYSCSCNCASRPGSGVIDESSHESHRNSDQSITRDRETSNYCFEGTVDRTKDVIPIQNSNYIKLGP